MKRLLVALLLTGCTSAPPSSPTPGALNRTAPAATAPPAAGNGTAPAANITGPGAASNGTADLPQTEAAPPAEDAGLPVYPGAKALGGGQLKLKGKLDAFLATLDYQTADSVAKVVTWYRQKLPQAKLTKLQEPGYELVTLQDPSVQITISRSGPKGPTLVNLVRQQR